MKQELQDQLFKKYPEIFIQKDLPRTCMNWGIECGDGWFNIIDTLCESIQHHVTYGKIEQIEAAQVKEKFGGLRFYVDGEDDYIRGLIRMAESMSFRTCDVCSSPGQPRGTGWIHTSCETHRNKQYKNEISEPEV
tara:strand:+ start:49 stop:453 length:405 start_codon:yes stop_codon:yes gene_type:complete